MDGVVLSCTYKHIAILCESFCSFRQLPDMYIVFGMCIQIFINLCIFPYFLTYLLTSSMEHSPSSEANSKLCR
jgi:hypothetical protein